MSIYCKSRRRTFRFSPASACRDFNSSVHQTPKQHSQSILKTCHTIENTNVFRRRRTTSRYTYCHKNVATTASRPRHAHLKSKDESEQSDWLPTCVWPYGFSYTRQSLSLCMMPTSGSVAASERHTVHYSILPQQLLSQLLRKRSPAICRMLRPLRQKERCRYFSARDYGISELIIRRDLTSLYILPCNAHKLA